MKSIKMFGKSVPLLAIVVISVLTMGVFGALLTQYGTVVTTATMEQSVLFDGEFTSVTDAFPGIGGRTYCNPYTLENRGHKEAPISFTAVGDPDLVGITVSYLKPVEYTALVTTTGDYVGYVTVEDLGEYIKWTIDVIGDRIPTEVDLASGGGFEYGLVISYDGIDPAFQVHGNGGTDALYPSGTHLYSEWVAGEGWKGWLSGWNGVPPYTANNIPVDQIDWIEATGDKYISTNTEGIYTISIKRCYLGETFSWAVTHATCGGFGGNLNYGFSATTGFDWDPAVIAYESAEIAEDISGYTLAMLETLDFYIVYDFDIALDPDVYTITSTVNVGP